MAHEASALLQELTSAALGSALLPTALFLAERLFAIDQANETSVYLYSLALWALVEAIRRQYGDHRALFMEYAISLNPLLVSFPKFPPY